jgi:hypothetical protein
LTKKFARHHRTKTFPASTGGFAHNAATSWSTRSASSVVRAAIISWAARISISQTEDHPQITRIFADEPFAENQICVISAICGLP